MEFERFGCEVENYWRNVNWLPKQPHSTTGISPFEALYDRKMRGWLTRLHPDLKDVPVGSVDHEKVSRCQDYMKDHVYSKRKHDEWNIQIGDWVRVQCSDGRCIDYEEVSEVRKASVTLKNKYMRPWQVFALRQINPSLIRGIDSRSVRTWERGGSWKDRSVANNLIYTESEVQSRLELMITDLNSMSCSKEGK